MKAIKNKQDSLDSRDKIKYVFLFQKLFIPLHTLLGENYV